MTPNRTAVQLSNNIKFNQLEAVDSFDGYTGLYKHKESGKKYLVTLCTQTDEKNFAYASNLIFQKLFIDNCYHIANKSTNNESLIILDRDDTKYYGIACLVDDSITNSTNNKTAAHAKLVIDMWLGNNFNDLQNCTLNALTLKNNLSPQKKQIMLDLFSSLTDDMIKHMVTYYFPINDIKHNKQLALKLIERKNILLETYLQQDVLKLIKQADEKQLNHLIEQKLLSFCRKDINMLLDKLLEKEMYSSYIHLYRNIFPEDAQLLTDYVNIAIKELSCTIRAEIFALLTNKDIALQAQNISRLQKIMSSGEIDLDTIMLFFIAFNPNASDQEISKLLSLAVNQKIEREFSCYLIEYLMKHTHIDSLKVMYEKNMANATLHEKNDFLLTTLYNITNTEKHIDLLYYLFEKGLKLDEKLFISQSLWSNCLGVLLAHSHISLELLDTIIDKYKQYNPDSNINYKSIINPENNPGIVAIIKNPNNVKWLLQKLPDQSLPKDRYGDTIIEYLQKTSKANFPDFIGNFLNKTGVKNILGLLYEHKYINKEDISKVPGINLQEVIDNKQTIDDNLYPISTVHPEDIKKIENRIQRSWNCFEKYLPDLANAKKITCKIGDYNINAVDWRQHKDYELIVHSIRIDNNKAANILPSKAAFLSNGALMYASASLINKVNAAYFDGYFPMSLIISTPYSNIKASYASDAYTPVQKEKNSYKEFLPLIDIEQKRFVASQTKSCVIFSAMHNTDTLPLLATVKEKYKLPAIEHSSNYYKHAHNLVPQAPLLRLAEFRKQIQLVNMFNELIVTPPQTILHQHNKLIGILLEHKRLEKLNRVYPYLKQHDKNRIDNILQQISKAEVPVILIDSENCNNQWPWKLKLNLADALNEGNFLKIKNITECKYYNTTIKGANLDYNYIVQALKISPMILKVIIDGVKFRNEKEVLQSAFNKALKSKQLISAVLLHKKYQESCAKDTENVAPTDESTNIIPPDLNGIYRQILQSTSCSALISGCIDVVNNIYFYQANMINDYIKGNILKDIECISP